MERRQLLQKQGYYGRKPRSNTARAELLVFSLKFHPSRDRECAAGYKASTWHLTFFKYKIQKHRDSTLMQSKSLAIQREE